jgi:hypothetical protein
MTIRQDCLEKADDKYFKRLWRRIGLPFAALSLAASWTAAYADPVPPAPLPGSWTLGIGGNVTGGWTSSSFWTTPTYTDGNGAGGGAYGFARYHFGSGWFVGPEAGGMGLNLNGSNSTGAFTSTRSLFFEGGQIGYGFTGTIPVNVYVGLDASQANTSVGVDSSFGLESEHGALSGWSAHAGVEFPFARDWWVGVDYRYAHQSGHFGDDPVSSNLNVLSLTFGYQLSVGAANPAPATPYTPIWTNLLPVTPYVDVLVGGGSSTFDATSMHSGFMVDRSDSSFGLFDHSDNNTGSGFAVGGSFGILGPKIQQGWSFDAEFTGLYTDTRIPVSLNVTKEVQGLYLGTAGIAYSTPAAPIINKPLIASWGVGAGAATVGVRSDDGTDWVTSFAVGAVGSVKVEIYPTIWVGEKTIWYQTNQSLFGHDEIAFRGWMEMLSIGKTF